jgi:hypothetical protein
MLGEIMYNIEMGVFIEFEFQHLNDRTGVVT